MDITVVQGNTSYINDCEDAISNSELGKRYFSSNGSARKSLEEGFSKDEIYVAMDNDNNCKGFVWVKERCSRSGDRENAAKVC